MDINDKLDDALDLGGRILAFYPMQIVFSGDENLSDEEIEKLMNTPSPYGKWFRSSRNEIENNQVGTVYATTIDQIQDMVNRGFPVPSDEDMSWISGENDMPSEDDFKSV
jgi:hypothetical protein